MWTCVSPCLRHVQRRVLLQVRLRALECRERKHVVGEALERRGGGVHVHDVAAQLEIESKIDAKLKAIYHILVSRADCQALSTWFSWGQPSSLYHDGEDTAGPQHAVRLRDDIRRRRRRQLVEHQARAHQVLPLGYTAGLSAYSLDDARSQWQRRGRHNDKL